MNQKKDGKTPDALEGIRVADFTWVLAGPHATKILGDFGAQVIKIEDRDGRDLARRLPPYPTEERGVNQSGYYINLNRNKLSATVDLRDPRGKAIAEEIVSVSDLVIENFSAGVMKRLGLDYESLIKIKPDMVMLSMAGLGQVGPMSSYVSYGPIIQALSGITYHTGYPNRPPVGIGYSYSDFVGGINGAYAAMVALHYRRRTGRGQFIDLSQLETSVAFLGPGLLDWTVNGRPPERYGNRPTHVDAAPHGVYRCLGDDRWCAIAVFTEEEWSAFRLVIGEPQWTLEHRFEKAESRAKHADELDRLVEEWTSTQVAEDVMEALQEAGVAAGVVQNAQDLIERDPHLKERGFYVELEHPEVGPRLFEGTPIKMSETPGGPRRAAPLLGQDNEFVYRDILGMPDEEFVQYIIDEVV